MNTYMRRGSLLLVVLIAAALLPTLSSRAETRSLFGRSAAFADKLNGGKSGKQADAPAADKKSTGKPSKDKRAMR